MTYIILTELVMNKRERKWEEADSGTSRLLTIAAFYSGITAISYSLWSMMKTETPLFIYPVIGLIAIIATLTIMNSTLNRKSLSDNQRSNQCNRAVPGTRAPRGISKLRF